MKNPIFRLLNYFGSGNLNIWEKYIRSYGSSMKDGYKTNAFSPLAWFVIFLIIPLLVLVLASKNTVIQYGAMGILLLVVLFCLGMYIILLRKDPKLLQSEKFRIEDRKMDLIAENGGDIKFIPFDLSGSDVGNKSDLDG